jgi:hypothetical protein
VFYYQERVMRAAPETVPRGANESFR